MSEEEKPGGANPPDDPPEDLIEVEELQAIFGLDRNGAERLKEKFFETIKKMRGTVGK